jgi:hypothetical protein
LQLSVITNRGNKAAIKLLFMSLVRIRLDDAVLVSL